MIFTIFDYDNTEFCINYTCDVEVVNTFGAYWLNSGVDVLVSF